MTEAAWLAAINPTPMLEFVRGKVSDRKTRLCAVACNRTIACIFKNLNLSAKDAEMIARENREAAVRLELVERLADNRVTVEEFRRCWNVLEGQWAWPERPWDWLNETINSNDPFVPVASPDASVRLFHDVFGNPFRPVVVEPTWLTFTVIALAQQMYESRDFSTMPTMADALQDAGCGSDDILNHCRTASVHVRGCWVVDLLLGKA